MLRQRYDSGKIATVTTTEFSQQAETDTKLYKR